MNLCKLLLKGTILFSMTLYLQCCNRLEDNEFPEPETVHGIIRDFSSIDGCETVIELDDGTIIIPYLLDTSLMLADGQEVEVAYTVLADIDYTCKAGLVAEITWLKMVGSSPILMQRMDNTTLYTNLPSDPFNILHAKIEDDCLEITLSYSGGCKVHEFIMTYTKLPHFGIYSGTLTLSHNAHGDLCEALITDKIRYDLIPLQEAGSGMVRLNLIKSGDQDYQLMIDYYYK
jgi:hypothetical protein